MVVASAIEVESDTGAGCQTRYSAFFHSVISAGECPVIGLSIRKYVKNVLE